MAIITIFVYTAMNHLNKVRAKYISAWLCSTLFIILTVQSRDKLVNQNAFHNFLTPNTDTVPVSDTINSLENNFPASVIKKESISDTIPQNIINKNAENDSSIVMEVKDTFDLKISRDSLDAPIAYEAEDSMVLDVPSKKITLYGKETKTNYKDNSLTAPVIELDQQTGNLNASIRRDSLGKVISMPTYKQGDFTSQSDSIRFNLKSGKGITKSTYTQQGEIYVYGETIKKFDNDVFFVRRARFTTCNLDTPHFAFISNRIKFIS
ncbi:MAG: hypothetical protein H0V14_02050, partial [Chitinophagaceae bacterium]|nr:hypothetical protein [Chitinophagaceae bacterium]